jgi:hypothetical protein
MYFIEDHADLKNNILELYSVKMKLVFYNLEYVPNSIVSFAISGTILNTQILD